MTTLNERRYAGVPLDFSAGGLELSVNRAGLMIPDPDDPNRIIVVPVSAARLIFCKAFCGAKPVVPEGW
jgi:hypothetical protein